LLWDAFYKSDLCQEPCYEREMYFCDYDTIEMKLKKSIEKKKKIEADLEQKEKFERLVREALKKN